MSSSLFLKCQIFICEPHFCFRLKNSNQLETSLQNGKTLLSTYENRLAREEVAPADISSLEKTQRELAVRRLFLSDNTQE